MIISNPQSSFLVDLTMRAVSTIISTWSMYLLVSCLILFPNSKNIFKIAWSNEVSWHPSIIDMYFAMGFFTTYIWGTDTACNLQQYFAGPHSYPRHGIYTNGQSATFIHRKVAATLSISITA